MTRHSQMLLTTMLLAGAWFADAAPRIAVGADKERPACPPHLPSDYRQHGIIIDPAGATIFLRNPADRVEAFDLKTGQAPWDSKAAFLPLVADGQRVVALGYGDGKNAPTRIVVLAARDGKVLKRSDPLPSGVWAEGTSYRRLAARIEDGKLGLQWSNARDRNTGGGTPMPPFQSIGQAEIDLDSGKVKVIFQANSGDPLPKSRQSLKEWKECVPDVKLPAGVVKELEALLPLYTRAQRGISYWPLGLKDGNSVPQPLVVGGKLVLLRIEKMPSDQNRIVRMSWDQGTGKPRPPVTLVEGGQSGIISTPGEFVCILQCMMDKGPLEKCPMRVFSLDSGKQISKLAFEPGPTLPLCLVGDRLLRMKFGGGPLKLESIDVRTGKTLGTRPIYQYQYKASPALPDLYPHPFQPKANPVPKAP